MDFTAQFRQPTTAQEVTDVMKAAVSDGLVPVVIVDINSIMNNGKCYRNISLVLWKPLCRVMGYRNLSLGLQKHLSCVMKTSL